MDLSDIKFWKQKLACLGAELGTLFCRETHELERAGRGTPGKHARYLFSPKDVASEVLGLDLSSRTKTLKFLSGELTIHAQQSYFGIVLKMMMPTPPPL